MSVAKTAKHPGALHQGLLAIRCASYSFERRRFSEG
jgi:hypothetical protein